MTITLFGIKNCDTMKKARKWLDTRGVSYVFHDYAAQGLDRRRLQAWCEQVGWEILLNRAGTTFRKLPETKQTNLDQSKAIELMAAQPAMVKRPVLQCGKTLLVGFKPEIYAREFG